MSKYLVYSVNDIIEVIEKMTANKFDCNIVISGKRGLGKSTLGLKIASRFKQFNMKKDVAFARTDVMDLLAEKKNGVILADEMINVTHNRDFYNEDQKKLIKMINMYRDSCNLFIACVPGFAHLDNQFRSLVKLRIDVIRRGVALIHTPNKSSYSTDVWDFQLNEKIERKWLERNMKNPNYSRLTTFRGVVHFGALGKKQQIKYDKLKDEKRNVVYEQDAEKEKKTNPYDIIYQRMKEGKITKEQLLPIALSLNLSLNSLKAIIYNRSIKDGITLKELYKMSSSKELAPVVTAHKDNKPISLPI